MKYPSGFSLIEFLIAISIGALITAIIVSIYVSNKSTFLIQEGLARLQENGRYANYLLSREIRMGGYQGCASSDQVTMNNLIITPTTITNYDTPVQGYDGLGTIFNPTLPTNISAKQPLATSDVIEIRRASSTRIQLSGDMSTASSAIPIYPQNAFNSGAPIMITNCIVGDIFIAGNSSTTSSITHTTAQNKSSNLSTSYSKNAELLPFLYYAFYIKNTGRVNSQNEPIPALYRLDINGNAEEIAEGVELMRVSYGVDANNDNTVDTYQTAAQINSTNNWNNIISIQINFLLATIDNVSDTIQPYIFNAVRYTPSDKKLRREWNTFVTLRNRGFPQ